MPDVPPQLPGSFLAGRDQPLIGVPVVVGDEEMVRYFTDEVAAQSASSRAGVERAVSALGAWADLDWEEAEAELERIRHATPPTPPIDL